MPTSPESLMEVINRNKSKKVAAAKIVESNPKSLPVLPKLLAGDSSSKDPTETDIRINRATLEKIYNGIVTVSKNNDHIVQLFPEIELAIQILVSSILSPKKMTDITINYKLDKDFQLNPAFTSKVLTAIKDHLTDNYSIEDKLPDIVRECLFETGAAVYAVIPEASVDQTINADILATYSTESFKERMDSIVERVTSPVNIIVPNKYDKVFNPSSAKAADMLEYMVSSESLKITDNAGILGFNDLKAKISNSIIKKSLRKGISVSAESSEKINYMDIFRKRTNTNSSTQGIEFVRTTEESRRKSIGKPMHMKIPTESVIPVFIPGDEKEHIGYFVLLDETGKPVSGSSQEICMDSVNSNLSASGTANVQNNVISKAYKSLVNSTTEKVNPNELFELYKDVLERQIFNSVKGSLYGTNVDISRKNDIYFLMFTRALAAQKTSLLYLPKELVTYFAFNYSSTGAGKTLLENLTVISSLRAIMLFSKVMAYSKQAIDVTKVSIALDPNDQDPDKTLEIIKDSTLKLRQNYLPLGINNPVDLVNWVQRAGLQFEVTNNPLMPDVKIEFSNSNMEHTVPDSELEEELRKQMFIALGLPPEVIDNAFSPEFAVSVVNNNILLSKRVMVYQKSLVKHIIKLISAIIYNDEDLRVKLTDLIAEEASLDEYLEEEEKAMKNKNSEEFMEYFINKISENVLVELPKPDNTNITNLAAEYDVYKENLIKVMDSVLSTDIFSSDVAGDMSEHVDTVKNIYIHKLLRDWMAENDFYPEALDLATIADDFTDAVSVNIKDHLTSVMRNSVALITTMQKFKSAVNSDLLTVEDSGAASVSPESGGSSEPSGSDPDSGGGGDGTGDEDVNLDW